MESTISNLGEVWRQRDLDKGRAPVEGLISNLGEVGRQRDVDKGGGTCTHREGLISNLGELGWQHLNPSVPRSGF